ncbi:MAG: indolepyruvate ferredoxin oxidoreductase family protein [Paracoccaceae bacterium]
MDLREVRLSDRYDVERSPVLVSGTQALVRATLMQRARDAAAGLDTAGYVTGYRGSPLGAVAATFGQAGKFLGPASVRFEAGLNEDLAATALWGAQQAGLRGEGRHQGVFGLWYGKGPGVDRSGDVFRHANLAGTAPHGGVLAAMGDDHTCESSTTCHQSEYAFMDAMIPVLSPAGVQELVDQMLIGWALSRFSGTWVGIKAMKDTVEATAVIDGDPHRLSLARPEIELPEGGLSIRLGDTPQAQEARLHHWKLPAVRAFARATRLAARRLGRAGARIGIVSAGKSWLDALSALDLLGIDESAADALGITAYKLGMVWPVEAEGLAEWARGLDLIVVVEEKRALIETQIRDALYALPDRPRVMGRLDGGSRALFPAVMDLDPAGIARGLARVLGAEGVDHAPMREGLARLDRLAEGADAPAIAERKPWFCAGCPHNTSTRVPEGSRGYAGIGCHYMVQWMDRETEGFTHMGGEGANWIGEAPFSERGHVFQNMGDGTYNHSGLMAIRAAIAAGTNITFKILYNDAVAMTGGQRHEGGLTPHRIAEELLAAGVKRLDCVYDEKEGEPELPDGVDLYPRERLMEVQRKISEVPGTTAILYVQTCAAEKRRRRKRGRFPAADRRVFINPSVCEGCGDCGRKSNCVAILPHETAFGRKRRIDQSSCNMDLSCLDGFCPSFVTVEGVSPKKAGTAFEIPELPKPAVPALDRPWGVLVTGIGGTGVVTVGALMTMAAHLEGKGASEMQMAGLAQKGGAVSIHCRLAPTPGDIHAVRLAAGEADAVIGGDVVVAASPKALALMEEGRTRAVLSTEEAVTGEFTRNTEFRLPGDRLRRALAGRIGRDALTSVDAQGLAGRLLGDTIYANVLLLGAAWQAGLVPLSEAALSRAIELNGAGVEGNLRAFALGRWAVADPAAVARLRGEDAPVEEGFDKAVERRARHLAAYQNERLAARYRERVRGAVAAERAAGVEGFARAVAEGYHKLLAYKDEYEVARLHHETLAPALAAAFEGEARVTFHMAPPLISPKDDEGRPVKRAFGPWMAKAFAVLRHGKRLRGTPLDPFGWTDERRMERRLIAEYEGDLDELTAGLSPATAEDATALARLPLSIRGFGYVKEANAREAAATRTALVARFRAGGGNAAPMATAAE